jgi:UDP-N-acetylglucosamine 2-epimerase (non-hydrolysing)
MTTYMACIGTRPEIIKMAPVCRELKERGEDVVVLHTGQHEEIAQALYRYFSMGPDYKIQLSRKVPTLSNLTSELMNGIDQTVAKVRPDVLMVQGDTSSALVGAMVGYYRDIPVAHIEAGLRTGHHDPFPEEKNRELIGRLARWHFPPTAQARENLLREGLSQEDIHEVGNTVIDSALWTREQMATHPQPTAIPEDVSTFLKAHLPSRLILVTAHRRENWGLPIRRIAASISVMLRLHPDIVVVWPLHPNPQVRADVHSIFETLDPRCRNRLCLTEPLEYPALIGVLAHSYFTLTDSGGIQEEASALGRPVLITRDSTERQELVDAGGAQLVGTDPQHIVEVASRLLRDSQLYASMQLKTCPFGDGHSARRIADVLTYTH